MPEPISIKTVIGATEVRNQFGKLLKEVHRGEKHFVVEKAGIPVAALISMREYEEFRRWLSIKLLNEMGRKLGAAAEQQGLTEERLIEEMEEDRRAVYAQTYGSSR
jgi:prevent-host-death family protein